MGASVVVQRTFRDYLELAAISEKTECLYLWGNDEADPDSILRIAESGRWSELIDLKGFFAGAYCRQGKAYLFCDRLGIYPLFYLVHKGRIYAAPMIRTIQKAASITPSPCREGIVSLLLFGHHLADETLFEGIRRCAGGQTVVIDRDGRIEETVVWKKPHLYQTQPSITPAELGELFVENVRTEISSCTEVLVALSGGFDSRAVFGAVLECVDAKNVHAITFGGTDTSDFKIGRLVAENAGVRSTVFPISDDSLDDEFLRQRGADYSHTYSAFATQPPGMIRFLADEDSRLRPSLWGVGGDAISGSHLHDDDVDLPRCEDFTARVRLLNGRLYIPVDVAAQIVGMDPSDVEVMVAGLLQRAGLDEYDQSWQFLDAWDIFVRGRMEIIGVLPFDAGSWRCPHLRGEYFRQMSTLCFSQKLHQAAYKEMLAQRFEALFSLPAKRLQSRSLVPAKGLAKSGLGLRAARAGSLLLRAVNLETDSTDRNYAKDRAFFRGPGGKERLHRSAATLAARNAVSCSVEKAVALGQGDVQVARMIATIAYAFDTDIATTGDPAGDIRPGLS